MACPTQRNCSRAPLVSLFCGPTIHVKARLHAKLCMKTGLYKKIVQFRLNHGRATSKFVQSLSVVWTLPVIVVCDHVTGRRTIFLLQALFYCLLVKTEQKVFLKKLTLPYFYLSVALKLNFIISNVPVMCAYLYCIFILKFDTCAPYN